MSVAVGTSSTQLHNTGWDMRIMILNQMRKFVLGEGCQKFPTFRLKKKLNCPERYLSHPAIAHEFSAQTCFTVHRHADSFL